MSLIHKARERATFAHTGQFRKMTKHKYITHPARVAKMVQDVGGNEDMIAAAWLHDVLEDTTEHINDFPVSVQTLVRHLTKIPGDKAGTIARFKEAPLEALIIKLADRIDNINEGKDTMGVPWLKTYMVTTNALLDIAKNRLIAHPLTKALNNAVHDAMEKIELGY